MTRSADFFRPIRSAARVLGEAGIGTYPVSPRQILRHYGIRCLSYRQFCQMTGRTVEECFSLFGRDASSVRRGDRYLILYNEERTDHLRFRFTVAHELGHIFLGHHEEAGTTGPISAGSTLYGVMEREADCFARNLLCPAPAVKELFRTYGYTKAVPLPGEKRTEWKRGVVLAPIPAERLSDAGLVERAFLLTSSAARVRLTLLEEDMRRTDSAFTDPVLSGIKHTVASRCRMCLEPKIPGARACYACGEKRFGFLASDKNTLPPPGAGIRRMTVCPGCGMADHDPEANYCTRCGLSLTNECEGTDKAAPGRRGRHPNPPFARYCLVCGKPTAYLKQNLLTEEGELLPPPPEVRSRKVTPPPKDELRFRHTLFCPRCGTDNSDRRTDCRICCCALENICTGCGFEAPPDARYCPRCGRETPFEVYHVFDPAVRKREARLAKSIIRRYDERGIYYEWDDGPHGWD